MISVIERDPGRASFPRGECLTQHAHSGPGQRLHAASALGCFDVADLVVPISSCRIVTAPSVFVLCGACCGGKGEEISWSSALW